ncbi:MAG: hypothetical protein AAFQ64_10195 [Pseudomonadota bacterium]
MQSVHPLVRKLLDLETLKTWSVIVTLFGDFDGDYLVGNQIKEILGHLNIKPEAIRVALHRLKADGWITAEKQGREAIYRLSPKGLHETQVASKDVYRQDVKYPEGWQFHLIREGTRRFTSIQISKDLIIIPVELAKDLEGSFVLSPQRPGIPPWIEEKLVPQHLLQNATALADVLEGVPAARANMSDLDARCLRLLVLHQWRRLALRLGSWAHIGLLPDGVLAKSHANVTAYLRAR